jgi:drug/metabolite transporter (DMT)-like permease
VTARSLRTRGLEVGLIGITAIWGLTFPMVKEATLRVPVYSFNAVRFWVAATVLAAVCLPHLRRLGRRGWRHGGVLGVVLFAGYAFQTVGLQTTRASTAGFITGMFVVFVPLLTALLLRRRPSNTALLGVALAFTGLALLALGVPGTPGPDGVVDASIVGELLVLGAAVSFALHIVGLGAWSPRHDPLPLTVVQLATAAVLHSAAALGFEAPVADYVWDGYVALTVLVTALLASAAAFWVQTAAQQVVSPTRIAIILTMEPVFAGLFGYLLLDERLTIAGWLGSGLILAGMLVAELRAAAEREPDDPQAMAYDHDATTG